MSYYQLIYPALEQTKSLFIIPAFPFCKNYNEVIQTRNNRERLLIQDIISNESCHTKQNLSETFDTKSNTNIILLFTRLINDIILKKS